MNIVNRILILAAFFGSFAFTTSSIAQTESKPKLVLGNVNFGPEAKLVISPDKIESALYLATGISKKYSFIDTKFRDSVLSVIKSKNPNFEPNDFVQALNADRMYFFQIDLLANMLRVHLNSLNPKTNAKSEGIGYALVHYFHKEDNKPLYDPALLLAVQRAIAVCEKDSLMYASEADSVFYALPSPTVVISGIEYKDDPALEKWGLFNNQEVNSYFALESIFDTLKLRKDIVLYDLATRDSIFSLFRLKIPENQRAASQVELSCLSKLEVELVISGTFTRIETGARLELFLLNLHQGNLSIIAKHTVEFTDDSRIKFRQAVQTTAAELMKKAFGR